MENITRVRHNKSFTKQAVNYNEISYFDAKSLFEFSATIVKYHLIEVYMLQKIVSNYEIITVIPPGDYKFNGNSVGQKAVPKYVYPDNTAERTLLDIGFGLGELGRILKTDKNTQHWHIDGVDGFFDTCCNVELFNKKYYRNIWHGLAQGIPKKQLQAYDMLCLFDVIEHLDADGAKQLLRSLLEALGDDSRLVLSTPLWFYPQDQAQARDMEEHLIGVPASSLLALMPLMYIIEPNFLVGTFVFSKKSLDNIHLFQPTTNRSFGLQQARQHLVELGVKADNVLYYVTNNSEHATESAAK